MSKFSRNAYKNEHRIVIQMITKVENNKDSVADDSKRHCVNERRNEPHPHHKLPQRLPCEPKSFDMDPGTPSHWPYLLLDCIIHHGILFIYKYKLGLPYGEKEKRFVKMTNP